MVNGNSYCYSVKNSRVDMNSKLRGKTIVFLGSSVTYGSASKGESFADFLEKIDGIKMIKEAVSGTTLADINDTSYISRMKKMPKDIKPDAFVVQLSTNDARLEIPLGKISEDNQSESYDVSTVCGAIEYIITYVKKTWKCPVVFYTGTQYDSKQYEKMVTLLLKISKKHNINVIDLWNDKELNGISSEEYNLYMKNGVHPKRAGYKLWWLPKIRTELEKTLRSKDNG